MGSMEISQILTETNTKGNFLASLLTDREGFTIASASSEPYNPEIQAAVIGLFQRATIQANEQLGVSISAEFTIYYDNGNLLVCRPFSTNKFGVVLAFLIPQKDQPYRRLMAQTIVQIQKAFEI